MTPATPQERRQAAIRIAVRLYVARRLAGLSREPIR